VAGIAADILLDMMVVNNELRTNAGGADEARALRAVNMAQHYFETICASTPRVLQGTANIATVANTETSAWSALLLRLDALWFLGTNGRPIYKVKRIVEIGGHVPSLPWPLTLSLSGVGSGQVGGYYGNMRDFYWMPLPSGATSLRIYGFFSQPELATRASAFGYPLQCKSALATFATKILKVGVDDDPTNLDDLASTIFKPLLRSLHRFDRSEPEPRYYGDVHTT